MTERPSRRAHEQHPETDGMRQVVLPRRDPGAAYARRVAGRPTAVSPTGEFDQFYEANINMLVRYLNYGLNLGDGLAWDAAQEAFLVMMKLWPRWQSKHERDKVRYLIRIAVNKSKELRSKDRAAVGKGALHRLAWADPDAPAPPAPSPETTALGRVHVEQLLVRLPEQQRKVLALTGCGLSGQQVADILEISIGTVHSTASAARANLRKLIDKEDLL
ncbi:RNA polymerase sigma factor [Nocardia gipuzkoensis]